MNVYIHVGVTGAQAGHLQMRTSAPLCQAAGLSSSSSSYICDRARINQGYAAKHNFSVWPYFRARRALGLKRVLCTKTTGYLYTTGEHNLSCQNHFIDKKESIR